MVIIDLYTTLFQSFRFLTNGHFPGDRRVPIRNSKMFIVAVEIVS